MGRTLFASLAAASLLILLISAPARAEEAETAAEPAAAAEDSTAADTGENESSDAPAPLSDEDFATSLIGKTYSGSFGIDGWTSLGGGLVMPPIYVQHYTKDNGTNLILTAKETDGAGRGSSAKFEITDALIAKKLRRGYVFSTACMKGEDYTLRFMGEVSGKASAEMWSNLRKAWEINIETGKISSVKPRGVKCTNPNW